MDAQRLKPVGCWDAGKRPDFEVVFKMAVFEIVRLDNLICFFPKRLGTFWSL